ncbi:hypothetical protein I4U23_005858 [Adineta vaga]|nr:hypothetical protein I4U23_005858 [Adineta vaga]
MRVVLKKESDEYNLINTKFTMAMKGHYKRIIKIERVQNEQWYRQYVTFKKDFKKRLDEDTERKLYHGCTQVSADLIIGSFFNRTFAGINGTVYGKGAYFSTEATYSHGYALPNSNGERCMFVVSVLVGKTTLGNTSMSTPPQGFDSTTDNKHIFVTYHDAQAYAEYLITYK